MSPPLIYNLFPRLVGPTTRWTEHAARAHEMGFNWVYLNPWHYPGFSGSLYAPKELRRLNPLFLPPGADPESLDPLREAVARMHEVGVRVMMDLVINHTSKDAPLVREHPEWFCHEPDGEVASPFAVDPDDPSKRTVWGDLAEVDNAHAGNRDALWAYWADLVRFSLDLGFDGFRCDAAYKVPAPLWRFLIEEAEGVAPGAEFFAETLGAPVEDIRALKEAGFHYFFNSVKWWDFREPWALKQHEEFRHIAPSVAFPESHDTARLAEESGGSEAVQRQRYAFAAAFSAGLMMPLGYEYGFRKQVNVVHTMPSDWERRAFDLRPFITRVNRLKSSHPLLQGEGVLRAPWPIEGNVLAIERRAEEHSEQRGWIFVNKSPDEGFTIDVRHEPVDPGEDGRYRLHRVCRDDAPDGGEPVPEQLPLAPSEVVYVLPV